MAPGAAGAGRNGEPLLADPNRLGADVEWISAWRPAQPRWWVELWNTVGHLDPPVGMVDKAMVPAAQRNAVIDAGWSVVDPMNT